MYYYVLNMAGGQQDKSRTFYMEQISRITDKYTYTLCPRRLDKEKCRNREKSNLEFRRRPFGYSQGMKYYSKTHYRTLVSHIVMCGLDSITLSFHENKNNSSCL